MKIRVQSTSPFDGKKHDLHIQDIEVMPGMEMSIDLDTMMLAVPFTQGDGSAREVMGFWYDGKFYLAGMPLDIKPGEVK